MSVLSIPPPVEIELTADDIEWLLAPAPPTVVNDQEILVVALFAEAHAYRLLAQAAVQQLHDLQHRFRQLTRRYTQLLDERRKERA